MHLYILSILLGRFVYRIKKRFQKINISFLNLGVIYSWYYLVTRKFSESFHCGKLDCRGRLDYEGSCQRNWLGNPIHYKQPGSLRILASPLSSITLDPVTALFHFCFLSPVFLFPSFSLSSLLLSIIPSFHFCSASSSFLLSSLYLTFPSLFLVYKVGPN